MSICHLKLNMTSVEQIISSTYAFNLPVFLVLKLVPSFLHLFKPKLGSHPSLPGSLFPTPVVECGFDIDTAVLGSCYVHLFWLSLSSLNIRLSPTN